jgi:hypothetical protein
MPRFARLPFIAETSGWDIFVTEFPASDISIEDSDGLPLREGDDVTSSVLTSTKSSAESDSRESESSFSSESSLVSVPSSSLLS